MESFFEIQRKQFRRHFESERPTPPEYFPSSRRSSPAEPGCRRKGSGGPGQELSELAGVLDEGPREEVLLVEVVLQKLLPLVDPVGGGAGGGRRGFLI